MKVYPSNTLFQFVVLPSDDVQPVDTEIENCLLEYPDTAHDNENKHEIRLSKTITISGERIIVE